MSLVLALLMQATFAPAPTAPPRAPCAASEFAALDFWVGDWAVYPAGKDTQVAESRIEKLYGGCAIRENWMPLKGPGGGSLTGYDPATGLWTQTWIGAQPGPVQFSGGPDGHGGMVLTGFWRNVVAPGQHAWVRMTYSVVAPGQVRQLGEQSTDNGATWQPSFDFIYKRKGT